MKKSFMINKLIKNGKKNIRHILKAPYMKFKYRASPQGLLLQKKNRAKTKSIVLLGTPEYGNLGDHLIARAEHLFLRSVFPNEIIVEVTQSHLIWDRNYVFKCINKDDLLIYTGGGFMGSLYMKNGEDFIRTIISIFPMNPIIIFPQTIFYENSIYGRIELNNACNIYKNHEKLILCVRDRQSYDLVMKSNLINKNRCFLIPDIALSLSYNNFFQSFRSYILLCLRSDKEATNLVDENEILLHLKQYDIKIIRFSTRLKGNISLKNRDKQLDSLINRFLNAKLVITDRLHAMILSAITATPCIAFNNSTNKVFGTYEWIKDIKSIHFFSDVKYLKCLDLNRMLQASKKPCFPNLNEHFSKLKDICMNEYSINC